MPELPDLEVIREYLASRIAGVPISAAQVLRPIIMRNLLGGDPADHLVGHAFADVTRRAKFLLLPLDSSAHPDSHTTLVINPMLAGRLRYGAPLKRYRKRDAFAVGFEDGNELLYNDAKDMGKIYLTEDVGLVPTFDEMGPEATDPSLTLAVLRERLRGFRGEIKGILVRPRFVTGIGNAYADEILWRARIYPFRRRPSLSDDDVAALHQAMQIVLSEAIETLRNRVGDDIHVEIRDFLAVHGKAEQPCPRCGSAISEVNRKRRTTHFCRACQPGILIGRTRTLSGE